MNKPQSISFDAGTLVQPSTLPADEGQGGELNIRALLQTLMVRRWTILSTIIAAMIVATLAVLQLTPIYSATTLLMIGQRQNKALDLEAVLSGLPTDAGAIENEIQVIKSPAIAERVIAKLKLDRDPEFNPSLGRASWLTSLNPFTWSSEVPSQAAPGANGPPFDPAIVKRFLNDLTAAAQGRSSIIKVSFDSPDRSKSAVIANAIADQYIVDQLETKFDAAKRATSWLNERLGQLAEQVRISESAVEQYKSENGLTDAKDGTTLTGQQLTELNGQIVIVRSNLAEQEAKYTEVSSLYRAGHGADSIAAVLNSPVISALRGQQAELMRKESALSAKYGERHPQIIALQDEKRNLDGKIQEEIKRVIQSLANEVAVARARLASLQTSLQQIQGTAGTQGQASIKLHALEREAESNRTLYQTFLARFKETEDKGRIQTPDARVIATATVPPSPSFPNKSLILGTTLLGSTLLGIVIALLLERLDSGYRSGADIERQMQLSNLAVVPMVTGVKKVTDRVVKKPLSVFSESIRSVYAGIQLSNVDDPAKVILFTSSVPNEGKTSIAVSLGRLAAKGGSRVILLDCDLRHPSVVGELSVGKPKAGLVELLAGKCDLASIVQRDPLSPLEYVVVTSPPSNPSDLISSKALKNLIETLRQHYDLVLLDAAPVIPVSDSRLLSRLADKVIYVVRWDHTPREAVALGLKMLRESGASMAGTVLNQADMRRYAIYGYGYASYGNGYGSYYAKYYTE